MPTEREIFDRIVSHRKLNEDTFMRELLVLGFVQYGKFDRVLEWEEKNPGQTLPPQRIQDLADGFTDIQIANFHRLAENSLRRHVHRHAGRRYFWFGVGQTLTGLALGALFVAVAALAADALGVLAWPALFP